MSDLICVYGLGNGELYSQYKEWLQENQEHYLIFLEDDASIYASFFSSPLLLNPQVKLYFITLENEEQIFKEISWEFLFLKFSYVAHPFYAENKKERMMHIFAKMAFFQSGVALLASDFKDCGLKVMRNFRQNSHLLPKASRGTALQKRFEKIPAIICGGGPSLEKNIGELCQLRERALIFAGGSALNVLSHYQLMPHFGASLDPDPPKERFLEQSAFESPFFYQERVSPYLLGHVHGPLLWMPSIGSYPLERWFAETLGLAAHPFDAGWTVSNFCTAIALHLGCNPIVFVGMDLSASDHRLYAPGVDEKKEDQNLILVHDSRGNPFYSRRDWVMSAEWTEQFAHTHSSTLFINATEGGVGFKGIEEIPLKEVASLHLTSSYDLDGKVHADLQMIEKIKLSREEVPKQWQLIDASLVRCQEKCRALLHLMEMAYPQAPFDKGEYIINEFDLEEELIYTHFLRPLWNIWQHLFKRRLSYVFNDPIGSAVNKYLFFQRALEGLWKDMK